MGCGGYSKISKTDVNGSVYKKTSKEEIQITLGSNCSILGSGPTIVFVYGGPGSKKGRLVSELVEVFDFTFINVEKIMLEKVGGGDGDGTWKDTDGVPFRKESVQELKKMLEDDPTAVSLSWILQEVTAQVDRNPQGRYLVDMMPNLKYLIRTTTFSQDCGAAMKQFEKKYPISFALYFSLTMGNKSKSQLKEEEQPKVEAEEETSSGFQSDEVDLSRTKRRQSMFESSVMSLLEYFHSGERLVQVDASGRNADAISSRTCHVLSGLSLQNLKLVNTVLIFVFDSHAIDGELLSDNNIELIKLGQEGSELSIESLENAIGNFVKQLNHKEHKTFIVDLSSTCIRKNTDVEICKSAITFVNEANFDENFDIPGCQGLFKAVSSLENAVCIFPEDTNPNLCKKIAVCFNNEFSNPREKIPDGVI